MAQQLYTKEMFLIAAEKCEVSMIDAKHIIKYIDEYVAPIELPSDEDIFNKSIEIMEEWSGSGCKAEIDAHFIGAKWMRDKILNK